VKGLVNVRALFISLATALILAFTVLPSNVSAMECDPCYHVELYNIADPERCDF